MGGGQNMRGRNNFNGEFLTWFIEANRFWSLLKQIVVGRAAAVITIATTTIEETIVTTARTCEVAVITSTVSVVSRHRWPTVIWSNWTFADRGGGNRGRYGNFNDDQSREEGFSGGRQNYGRDQNREGHFGHREERFNSYGGSRGSHNRGGGAAGSGFEQERRTSESMSQLSLEGNFRLPALWLCLIRGSFRAGRWSTKVEFGSEDSQGSSQCSCCNKASRRYLRRRKATWRKSGC